MAEVDQTVAASGKVPVQPDVIGPITSLAQLQYLQANAQRLQAETGQIGLNTQFTQGKLGALQKYNDAISAGAKPEDALGASGLAGYDPAGANAILGNVSTGMDIAGRRGYAANPGDPYAAAAGGPALVGTAATAAETNLKNVTTRTQLYGQIGNIMASDPSPQGRAQAIALARSSGVPDDMIQKFASLPDDQYVLAGKHFQQASMTPEKYMDVSGQATGNRAAAEANYKPIVTEPQQRVVLPPGLGGVVYPGRDQGQPAPAQGNPSLGNFGPPGAAGPSLASPTGVAPAPSAPAPVASAAPPAPAARPAATTQPFANPAIPAFGNASSGNPGGLSPQGLARTIQIESGGNPNATNGSAAGLGQFEPDTWKKYGQGSPFDPGQAIAATARYSAANAPILANVLGRAPSDAELYLAHQQGGAGAAKLLANPTARAGDVVGDAAIRSNGGDPNAPASAFTNMWIGKFNGPGGATAPGNGQSMTMPAAGQVGAVPPLAPIINPAKPATPSPQGQGLAAPIASPTPAAPIAPVADQSQPTPAASAAPAPGVTAPPTGLAADAAAAPLTAPRYPGVPANGPVTLQPGMSLSQKAETEEQGKAYGELPAKLDAEAGAAKTMNATLDQMGAAANGTWQMGKWAPAAETLREGLQSVAHGLGINTPDLDKPIANYQDYVKLAGNISREAAHETSSRVGVQEMQLVNKSLPSPEMSEGGFGLIKSQMKGLNDFTIAKQQAAGGWRAINGNSLGPSSQAGGKDFQTVWNENASPVAFVVHRMIQENPDAAQQMLTKLKSQPGGKQAFDNIIKQTQWANDAGLLQ